MASEAPAPAATISIELVAPFVEDVSTRFPLPLIVAVPAAPKAVLITLRMVATVVVALAPKVPVRMVAPPSILSANLSVPTSPLKLTTPAA